LRLSIVLTRLPCCSCRQCSSGLQAIADVAAAIKAGYYSVGLAAGAYTWRSFLFFFFSLGSCDGSFFQGSCEMQITPCMEPLYCV
jgi:hypothetical protein